MDDWRFRALCPETDPEVFFPLGHESEASRASLGRAKAVCQRCPVTAECLRFALDNGLDDGVFGGASPAERRAIKQQADRTVRSA